MVTGLDRRIDPDVPQVLDVPNGPGERHDAAEPNSLGDGNDPVDYSALPTTEAGGPQDRSAVLVRIAHCFKTMNKADDDLRPMTSLEEEELAAWIMVASSFLRHTVFLSVRTRHASCNPRFF